MDRERSEGWLPLIRKMREWVGHGGGVEGDVLFVSGSLDIQFRLLLYTTLAFGEERYFASILQRGVGEESDLGRSAVDC